MKGVLRDMQEIAFNTTGMEQTYDSQESIIVSEEKDRIVLNITKQAPSPGHTLCIDKIVSVTGGYKVYLNINPPKSDMMQLQVITYKTITIEIDKRDLDKFAPYKFTVEGIKSDLYT